MDELNKVVQAMALAKFKQETNTQERMQDYFLKHATLGEFVTFFTETKGEVSGISWAEAYKSTVIGNMQGLMEDFLYKVVYKRRKDMYIKSIIFELESKVETKYKITIEQVQ